MSDLPTVVLVVGPMRTGTTLVADLLGSHPDVVYLGFELAEEWATWTGLPWGAPGADDLTCPALEEEHATPERVTAVRDGLSSLLAARLGGASRPTTVVLKSPHVWHRLPFVRTVLPGVRIVRTRRDRVPTVASLQRLWERSLASYGRVHHLPTDPDRCWDFVPADDAGAHDPARTFPGGDVGVLAEFLDRVDDRLDAFAAAEPDRVVAEVTQEELVRDPDGTSARLLAALGLPPATLIAPEPLDPARLDESVTRLTEEERRRLGR